MGIEKTQFILILLINIQRWLRKYLYVVRVVSPDLLPIFFGGVDEVFDCVRGGKKILRFGIVDVKKKHHFFA